MAASGLASLPILRRVLPSLQSSRPTHAVKEIFYDRTLILLTPLRSSGLQTSLYPHSSVSSRDFCVNLYHCSAILVE